MTGQVLAQGMTCYRIGDPTGSYPIFDATGSTLFPGRWNTPGSPMIYAARSYSTALLEKLVHGAGTIPPNQHFIEITIDRGASYEMFSPPNLAGWDDFPPVVSKAYGETWFQDKRSLLLIVPSVVARQEQNVLINPTHSEFPLARASLHQPVHWDKRLFGVI
ncbi:MAG: hypothetical protein DI565_16450 [Ancylobacter novellus]|uniref:RES domain-containing protein n=1 Tax=Ancylobacter novellus TaxID=921 RepID=A0A2W5K6G2_ANCNO|nr:MAG: hypothetical protein DI565_16450 [Ancylobacter novellus]